MELDERTIDQVTRLLREVFNDAGDYPWKDLSDEQMRRIDNQFDRRLAMIGM
uniref:Uncharacterized protein n=1 Tax=viral metagenome TaxID=1070528 RepID=A0A6M3II61_9ZZZZ